jgi:hypothetical protein
VELDASTEGKDPSLLFWLRYHLGVVGYSADETDAETMRPPFVQDAAVSETVYVHVLGTDPEDQDVIVDAATSVVGELRRTLPASRAELLRSDDRTRIAIVTRWRGPAGPRLRFERSLVQRALAEHPDLARATPLEAHLYRRAA